MGVYLSSPVTEKISADKSCEQFTYGVSSMQGWRMSQEDAHNCISDFDASTNTSFFAVYDGHGGAEVAQYTAAHFPAFLKDLSLYKEGKLAEALQEAFLGFDQTLTDEKVIQELKTLAGVDDDENDDVEDEEGMGRSEHDLLVAEANMPIEELMARYSGHAGPTMPQIKKLQKDKHQSPMLRAKKVSHTGGDGDKNNSADQGLATRLDAKLENGETLDNENNLNVEKELLAAESDSSKTLKESKSDGTDGLKNENVNNSNNSANADATNDLKTNGHSAEGKENDIKENGAKTAKPSEADSSSNDKNVDEIKQGSSSPVSSVSQTSETEVSSSVSASSSKADSDEKEPAVGSSVTDVEPSSSAVGSAGSEPGGSGSSSGSSSSQAGPSGSGAGPSGSGAGPSGSGEGPSGSGVKAGGSGISSSKKSGGIMDEDFDSDDDDSDDDDEEYEEGSEEEDDDDDEDEDEEDSEEGGIFGFRSVGGGDEEDHIEEPGTDSGCTAVVVLVRDDKVYVANAGDSRCVLCQAGKAVDLSFDHKPEDESERTRIEAAGGKVTADGRVNGGLNLSRALGDHWYKRNETKEAKDQMISALPDIECATLTPDDEFLVIACDGIWNFMTSQETVDFIRERLKDPTKREKPSLICEELFDYCLAPNTMGDGTGCDNMTCIIVVLNRPSGRSKRDVDSLDESASDEKQPEKRARLEGVEENTAADS